MTKPLTTSGHDRAALRAFSIVPLLTPATPEGAVDEPAVTRLVEHIVAGGCQGLMVCGTTGEFASLTIPQRQRLVRLAIAAAGGRALVFGGIGDTCLEHSVQLAHDFLAAGAAAVVANLPSYYPLSPEMMEAYFTRMADRIAGPVYLYNIPQTTRQSIPLDVIERLSRHPRIVGLKDSEPDAVRQQEVSRLFAGRSDFAVFCGSISFTRRAVAAGADGFVPGAGNFAPALTCEVIAAICSGDDAAADAAQARIDAVNATYQRGRTVSQLFGSLKAILELHGLCGRHMFPPLLPASDSEVAQLRTDLRALGLLP